MPAVYLCKSRARPLKAFCTWLSAFAIFLSKVFFYGVLAQRLEKIVNLIKGISLDISNYLKSDKNQVIQLKYGIHIMDNRPLEDRF
jgi:hypothetical protein